jgi:hypothetical protein
MSFPRRPTARATFLSGKVTKAIGAGHDGLANVRLARLALRFSPDARRRELARPCAQTVAPFPRARLRCSASCDGAEAHFDTAIHGLPFDKKTATIGRRFCSGDR